MRLLIFSVFFLAQCSVTAMSTANTLPPGLKRCGQETVADILTGDRLTLANGKTLMLADIKAPEYWPEGAAYKSWPYGHRAKTVLERKLAGQSVTLYCGKKALSPFGDTVAHVVHQDVWLQKWLIAEGHAYFFPTNTNPDVTDDLRRSEEKARNASSGLWRISGMHPVDALSDGLKPGWFQLVTGNILEAKRVGKTVYLNFEEDWRRDFTVQMSAKQAAKLAEQGYDIRSLAGVRVEVRGFVEWSGGPKIILDHPDQLQILAVSEAR